MTEKIETWNAVYDAIRELHTEHGDRLLDHEAAYTLTDAIEAMIDRKIISALAPHWQPGDDLSKTDRAKP